MPYEHDIGYESVTSTVGWAIPLVMFAASVAMILFVLATH